MNFFLEQCAALINSPFGGQLITMLLFAVPILIIFSFVYQDEIIEKISDGVMYCLIYGIIGFVLYIKFPRLKDVFVDAVFLGCIAMFLRSARKLLLLLFEKAENSLNKR